MAALYGTEINRLLDQFLPERQHVRRWRPFSAASRKADTAAVAVASASSDSAAAVAVAKAASAKAAWYNTLIDAHTVNYVIGSALHLARQD